MLRHKFFSLLSGHVPSREDCEALLERTEGTEKPTTRSSHRLRPGKHNMAKGALRPEDAAVCLSHVLRYITHDVHFRPNDFQLLWINVSSRRPSAEMVMLGNHLRATAIIHSEALESERDCVFRIIWMSSLF